MRFSIRWYQLLLCSLAWVWAVELKAQSVYQHLIDEDIAWNLDGWGKGGVELYDERALSINGLAGVELTSVSMSFEFQGTFDDSIALDLNKDGTIDYVASLADAQRSGVSNYTPWDDASPLRVDITWTQNGITVQTYWNNIEIIAGASNAKTRAGFSNLNGLSLLDLGLAGDFTLTSSQFTSDSFYLGTLNSTGGSSSHQAVAIVDTVNLEDSNGNTYFFDNVPIPEPSTFLLFSLFAIKSLTRRSRSKA